VRLLKQSTAATFLAPGQNLCSHGEGAACHMLFPIKKKTHRNQTNGIGNGDRTFHHDEHMKCTKIEPTRPLAFQWKLLQFGDNNLPSVMINC